MDELDYDLQHVSGVFREGESLVVDISQRQKPLIDEEQAKAVELSKNIIALLEKKLKLHNAEHSKRIKLYQLKKAFCKGARMYNENPKTELIKWGLARVNLFLRISSGKISDINLELKESNSYNSLMDIANHFTPSEIDFEQAKTDVENHDLDHHFESVDELYIDEEPESLYYFKD